MTTGHIPKTSRHRQLGLGTYATPNPRGARQSAEERVRQLAHQLGETKPGDMAPRHSRESGNPRLVEWAT